ncbi:MAG: hypothetical protein HYZ87_00085 [Candidatus Omnitrophica bacterium]|nr:hypothetical protein [Candidatus Omnitrophota bacterium]
MVKRNFYAVTAIAGVLLLCRAALADDGFVSQKLDRVLQNQERILKTLDEVKEELQVVKVRASNR